MKGKSLAVCAFSLLGVWCVPASAQDEQVGYKRVTNDFTLGLNLTRTAKLDVRVGELKAETFTTGDGDDQETIVVKAATTNKSLAYAAASKLKELLGVADANACNPNNKKPEDAQGLFLTIKPPSGGRTNQKAYTELISEQITAGLAAIEKSGETAYTNDATARNLAYIMYADAVTFGCAETSGCESGTNYILCKFKTETTEVTMYNPLPKNVYDALKARQDANIKITGLLDKDLNTPLTPETGNAVYLSTGGLLVLLSLGMLF